MHRRKYNDATISCSLFNVQDLKCDSHLIKSYLDVLDGGEIWKFYKRVLKALLNVLLPLSDLNSKTGEVKNVLLII